MKRKGQFTFRGFLFFIMFIIIFIGAFPIMKAVILDTASGQSPMMILLIKSLPFVLLIFGALFFLFGGGE